MVVVAVVIVVVVVVSVIVVLVVEVFKTIESRDNVKLIHLFSDNREFQ